MKNNIENIIQNVLIRNRISNYDKKDLELQLQMHPSYPSFQSITDTLDYFNIDNLAVEVPVEALDQLPESFISIIKTKNDDEIVSVIRRKNTIQLKYASLPKKNFTYEEFKEIWIPKVIAVEKSIKSSVFANYPIFQVLLVGILVLSSLYIMIERGSGFNSIAFLTLSLTGMIFSFFAVRESLGIQSQTMHQFCTSVGSSDCGDVINNNSGELFKNFSFTDAGMIFFGSLVLYQLFYGFNSALLVPSLLSIPIVIYSFYSQAFTIKKWCVICMVIGITSVGLIILSLRSFSFSFDVSLIFGLVMISAIFTLVYNYGKKKIKENMDYKTKNVGLVHFKRDFEIFSYLLNDSERVTDNTIISNEIVMGNPQAVFKIISLTNPMCGFCKEAFESYTRVLRTMSDQVQIVIRLKVDLEDLQNQATQISLKLIEIYTNDGVNRFIKAYTDWFADRTYDNWMSTYGKSRNDPKGIQTLKKQSEWAEKNNLNYTPATLINDVLYPKKYSYDEFFYFINTMVDNHNASVVPLEEPVAI